jgi:uncharacterized Rmd1/YagE family protein
MSPSDVNVRALLLGEGLDLKGLEREDCFSTNPLGFRTSANGTAMLFKSGAAVFLNMTPIEEEALIKGLEPRIIGRLEEREVETAVIVTGPAEDELLSKTGAIQLKSADLNSLLLVGEVLAVSVALAYDERRISAAFDKTELLAASLIKRRLPAGPNSSMLEQIGGALLIQKRLVSRADLDEKPDVLWDHPELERLWAKLVDEYDLVVRARSIERKLAVIRETAGTISDLLATRTSHRLELLIIALIAIEILLALWDRLFK